MNKAVQLFVLFFMVVVLCGMTGCGKKIYGLSSDGAPLIGKIKGAPMEKPVSAAIHFPRNIIVCKGVLTPGERFSDATTVCEGAGSNMLTCTGGTPVTVDWVALSCAQGYGVGTFPSGDSFSFVWGFRSYGQGLAAAKLGMESAGGKTVSTRTNGGKASASKSSEPELLGSGSGFLVTAGGLMVTNAHVIKEGSTFVAYDSSHRKAYKTEVLAVDRKNDLAVLQVFGITGRGLPLADKPVRKGEDIMALGYPVPSVQGAEQKATFGRVNSLTGMGNDVASFQMDAPIQPGNSGGPVINMRGEVVGISTYAPSAETKNTYQISGVYYAVKADYVRAILRTLPNEYKPVAANPKKAAGLPELVERCESSVLMLLAFE